MWYYVEGWTRNKLYFVIQSSTGNQTVLIRLSSQSRRWKHFKVEFAVNTTFQVKYIYYLYLTIAGFHMTSLKFKLQNY